MSTRHAVHCRKNTISLQFQCLVRDDIDSAIVNVEMLIVMVMQASLAQQTCHGLTPAVSPYTAGGLLVRALFLCLCISWLLSQAEWMEYNVLATRCRREVHTVKCNCKSQRSRLYREHYRILSVTNRQEQTLDNGKLAASWKFNPDVSVVS